MSQQVSFQVVDLSKDISLLSQKQQHAHDLFQLLPLVPFAPFLIKLFTHDSKRILQLFNNGHLIVLSLIHDLPFSVLKRMDFWELAWKELTQKLRNHFSSLVLKTISALKQLNEEEKQIVYQTAIGEDVHVDYEQMAQEDNSLLSNIDFIINAIKNRVTLTGVDNALLESREFISKQIEVDPHHFNHEWKIKNKDLLIKSFEFGLPIYWIGDVEPLENDEQVVLKAVEVDNFIINEIPSKFVQDKEFVKKAISLNGMNYKYFKGLIYSDIEDHLDEFEMGLVANNSKCLTIIEPKFSTHPELIEKLIELNPFVVQYIPNVEFPLLEKAGQVMLKQFKEMSEFKHKTEEIKCKDWKTLIRRMKLKRATDDELWNNLNKLNEKHK